MGSPKDSELLGATVRYVQDSPLSAELKKKLSGWIRSRDLPRLCSATSLLNISPEYQEEFKTLRQVEAFFKKNASYSDRTRCTAKAERNFWRAERICAITNKRLDWYYTRRGRLDPDLSSQLSIMEAQVSALLGDFRDFLGKMPNLLKVTSGATQDRSRPRALPFLKITGNVRAPARAKHLLYTLCRHVVGEEPAKFTACDTNRIALVAKNWSTFRTVACEATHSVPLQLAFDSYAKTKLRRVGVDLTSQTRNQELAREGSIFGNWCTVDGEMASDLCAYNAVAWMFPSDWFHYLSSCRAGWFEGVFGRGKYSKFSSMGNGSTFAIETILFWAACRAVGSKNPAVYGDDIVIESELFVPLKKLLNFIGFKINVEKTFSEGPFRESCGTDWFDGANITPFYVRKNPRTRSDWCHFVNGMAAIATPDGELWNYLIALIAERELPLGPYSDDSRACVHMDVNTCYALKLLYRLPRRHGARSSDSHWSLFYTGYQQRSDKRVNRGRRSLLLWFFHKLAHQGSAGSAWTDATFDPDVVTVMSVGSVRSVRKDIAYFPSSSCTPAHLWLWSSRVVGSQGRNKGRIAILRS